jgi:hypothetical protein
MIQPLRMQAVNLTGVVFRLKSKNVVLSAMNRRRTIDHKAG